MFGIAGPTIAFFGMIGVIILLESRKRRPCPHLRTRCLHGDEINARMKVYTFRFWKETEHPRQVCRDCGRGLNRLAICTSTREDLHEWEGPWPYEEKT